MSSFLIMLMSVTANLPMADVEEFIDNRNGTATLKVVCANGARVQFTVDRKRLDMMDVEAIYAIIYRECKGAKP